MGLGDIVAGTLIRVKADTSQAKAEIRSLRGVEKQAATERLTELEKTNRGIDKQIATWGKVALAVGAGVTAFKVAQAAANAYLEDLRLESASAGANIDKLRQATLGLIETDHLMAFAGKAMNGVWKLNQSEMETVLRGATALRKTMGVELQPTIEKLTESIAKGSTRALKEFGIEAKDKQGALRELNKIAASLGGNFKLAGDDMQASGIKIADTFDDLQGALGKFVMTLEPAARVLADFVGWLAQAGRLSDAIAGVDTQGGTQEQKLRRDAAGMRERAALMRATYAHRADSATDDDGATIADLERAAAELDARANAAARKTAMAAAKLGMVSFAQSLYDNSAGLMLAGTRSLSPSGDRKRSGRGAGSGASSDFVPPEWLSMPDFRAMGGAMVGAGVDVYGKARQGGIDSAYETASADAAGRLIASRARAKDMADREGNLLSNIFGTPAEVEKMVALIEVASGAFETLTGAATAAFDAWITGSESIGAAFSKAVANGLKANAVQMLGEAIKHGAFALGELAFGNFKDAAAHGASAAKFAAGAVAMGVLAKGLGKATGQWSQGSSAGGGGGGGSAARTIGNRSSADQDNRPINVYVGAEWAGLSSQMQSQSIRNAIRRHSGGGSKFIRKN